MNKMMFAVFIGLFAAGLFACMKKPDMTPNYGQEVSLEDIQKAVSSDSPLDLMSIKKNQYISIDETQAIDTNIPETIFQRLDQVTDYQDKPTEVDLSFKVTMKEYVNGQWMTSTQSYGPYSILKSSGAANPTSLNKAKALGHKPSLPLSLQSLRKMESTSAKKITYHNLTRATGVMPVPEVVKAHPNCGGVLKCDVGLRFLKVTFDQVVWDSDDHGIKTAYTIVYSPDIPVYIHDWDNLEDVSPTNQYRTCAQTWIEVQNGNQKQTVPVLQCAQISDFQFGS